ncbi:2-amino-4-hydroxy-6-hydroxymethyldihydropteridine diphosphokinase [Bacillus ectoiniformans]|uniref:2-amino-4-hydroxy-6- hydroxymethyldihydropteridine diphosphokinase n=1 Tax=Bacillus ectoiniformans TaxID=1494429 RepID=UPI00195E8C47|nr:2-amino-4-hydroxy-6-hydroxymethyldihydropteridine diphosphokinase [Bacillus ectoiniformans]MBM7650279.1 2-amino-4-hydroxy-6-hydroxymethyldihydropteridine diphosphokinase [Bacillus ectoiniformans]
MKINKAYLSLGTNIGDRGDNLQRALKMMDSDKDVQIERVSSIYETEPVGYTEQAPFLNMAVCVATGLSAEELLDRCLGVERELGRVREFKWGPRIIDLDILLYNHDNIESETLIIPHPRMHERAFVLIPLLEIDSTIIFPADGTLLKEALCSIQGKEGVRLWKQINGDGEFGLFEN